MTVERPVSMESPLEFAQRVLGCRKVEETDDGEPYEGCDTHAAFFAARWPCAKARALAHEVEQRDARNQRVAE